jgi:hypothetical protein
MGFRKSIKKIGKTVKKIAKNYSGYGMAKKAIGAFSGGKAEEEPRAEAAGKMLKDVNRQAGSGQVKYTGEFEV